MAAMKVQINDRQNGQEGVATPSFMQNLREDASERLKTIHGRKTLSATPDSWLQVCDSRSRRFMFLAIPLTALLSALLLM
jgi:hypothetical protein